MVFMLINEKIYDGSAQNPYLSCIHIYNVGKSMRNMIRSSASEPLKIRNTDDAACETEQFFGLHTVEFLRHIESAFAQFGGELCDFYPHRLRPCGTTASFFKESHYLLPQSIGLVPPRNTLCLLCGSGKDVEEIESHDDKVVGEFKYVVLAYRHEVTRRVCHKRACVALCESEEMFQLQCVGRSEAFLHRVGTVVGVGYDIHFAVDKEHELVAHVVLLPYDLAFGELLKMKFRLAYHLCQFVLAHALKERYLQ